mgnify:CR=1 FL=1
MKTPLVKVHETAELLLENAVSDFLSLLQSQPEDSPNLSVVLTGGSLGIGFLSELSRRQADLSRVDFIFGDERFVALDNAERNEHQGIMAFTALENLRLRRYPSPPASLNEARDALNEALEASYGPIQGNTDVFDLVLLGVGPDGHVASLFPGHTGQGDWVVSEDNSPKPPSQRLSLSYKALNRSKQVWFLASGEAKANVVGQALQEGCSLPLAKVEGTSQTVWYLDKELSDAL